MPLDWGLGHATRCIPIIKELLINKCEVWVGASGDQKTLLQEEFPSLIFIELPGYGIKYGKNRAFTFLKIIASIPKILIRVNRENQWFRQFCRLEKPDAVISDNRYGLYAPGVYSVFITHQLRIRTFLGRYADALVQRLHYRMIRRFSVCWVPDKEEDDLAGELSHPSLLPAIPTRYIGLLSRMAPGPSVVQRADLLVLLSGPEPQRTVFEKMVLSQLEGYSGTVVLVRGLPGGRGENEVEVPGAGIKHPNLTVFPHLPARELGQWMSGASLILCRSGYSTLMDLARLGKKAILVPTPGQTEQEYLGRYWAAQRKAICVTQSKFSLPAALAAAQHFPFSCKQEGPSDLLQMAIDQFLEEVQASVA